MKVGGTNVEEKNEKSTASTFYSYPATVCDGWT